MLWADFRLHFEIVCFLLQEIFHRYFHTDSLSGTRLDTYIYQDDIPTITDTDTDPDTCICFSMGQIMIPIRGIFIFNSV